MSSSIDFKPFTKEYWIVYGEKQAINHVGENAVNLHKRLTHVEEELQELSNFVYHLKNKQRQKREKKERKNRRHFIFRRMKKKK